MNTINFCKLNFFTKTPTCKKSMKDWGSARNTNPKEGLINYQCQGHTVLHELFHLDSLSKVATTGHITDRKIRYKDYKDYKNDTGYRRAYGPEDVKLLASWANSEVGKYMVTNADNIAQYSLAKWIQKKTGLYPRHPARDRSRIPQDPPDSLQVDEVAASPEVVDPLDDSLVEPPEICDDVDAAGNCNETESSPHDLSDAKRWVQYLVLSWLAIGRRNMHRRSSTQRGGMHFSAVGGPQQL
ncbi:hypothetical protein ACEPPN_007102 [Leptodophora sp. 'Broadleaf-Isolate-01']